MVHLRGEGRINKNLVMEPFDENPTRCLSVTPHLFFSL